MVAVLSSLEKIVGKSSFTTRGPVVSVAAKGYSPLDKRDEIDVQIGKQRGFDDSEIDVTDSAAYQRARPVRRGNLIR